jgi:hypothetical protein
MRILPIVRWILFVWGGVSLFGTIVLVVFLAFQLGGNRNKSGGASASDVRFVLNWCRLGEERIEKVRQSHVSSRSLTGDYLNAYAIEISHVDIAELTKPTRDFDARWYRGDQLPKVLDDAVSFVGGWLHRDEISWFPREAELRSAEFYVYPWSIYCHGVRPSAAQLIFIRPADKMVFYFGAKS